MQDLRPSRCFMLYKTSAFFHYTWQQNEYINPLYGYYTLRSMRRVIKINLTQKICVITFVFILCSYFFLDWFCLDFVCRDSKDIDTLQYFSNLISGDIQFQNRHHQDSVSDRSQNPTPRPQTLVMLHLENHYSGVDQKLYEGKNVNKKVNEIIIQSHFNSVICFFLFLWLFGRIHNSNGIKYTHYSVYFKR